MPNPCPHFAHNFTRASLIQRGRNRLQIVIEQVGVDVQRHRRRGVAEHLLHRLDVRVQVVWFDVCPVMCVCQFAPDKGPTPQYVSELSGLRHSEPMLRAAQLSSAFACGAAAKPAKTTATAARMVVTALRFETARRSMRPASLLDDAARLKGTSDVAHPVARGNAKRPTHSQTSSNYLCTNDGWKQEYSRRAGAETQLSSESSHRTTSIAAMTALNGSARRTRRGPGGQSGHRSQRSPRCQQ